MPLSRETKATNDLRDRGQRFLLVFLPRESFQGDITPAAIQTFFAADHLLHPPRRQFRSTMPQVAPNTSAIPARCRRKTPANSHLYQFMPPTAWPAITEAPWLSGGREINCRRNHAVWRGGMFVSFDTLRFRVDSSGIIYVLRPCGWECIVFRDTDRGGFKIIFKCMRNMKLKNCA